MQKYAVTTKSTVYKLRISVTRLRILQDIRTELEQQTFRQIPDRRMYIRYTSLHNT
jgi:hypothetical protein